MVGYYENKLILAPGQLLPKELHLVSTKKYPVINKYKASDVALGLRTVDADNAVVVVIVVVAAVVVVIIVVVVTVVTVAGRKFSLVTV